MLPLTDECHVCDGSAMQILRALGKFCVSTISSRVKFSLLLILEDNSELSTEPFALSLQVVVKVIHKEKQIYNSHPKYHKAQRETVLAETVIKDSFCQLCITSLLHQ